MDSAFFATPLGTARIMGNEDGISEISILDTSSELSLEIPGSLARSVDQLNEYFSGTRTEFSFAMNPSGTDFQRKVWSSLLKIPFGKAISYLELSKSLGDPKAIRAVASANAKNPLWIVIPCHRVIGSDHSLTGYAGGLWRKKWLLEHESGTKQQSLF